MNIISWVLAFAGAIAFVAFAIAFVCTLTEPRSRAVHSESDLHHAYQVISHFGFPAWPYLLVMTLAASIAIIGFCRTDYFMRRMMEPRVQQADQT